MGLQQNKDDNWFSRNGKVFATLMATTALATSFGAAFISADLSPSNSHTEHQIVQVAEKADGSRDYRMDVLVGGNASGPVTGALKSALGATDSAPQVCRVTFNQAADKTVRDFRAESYDFQYGFFTGLQMNKIEDNSVCLRGIGVTDKNARSLSGLVSYALQDQKESKVIDAVGEVLAPKTIKAYEAEVARIKKESETAARESWAKTAETRSINDLVDSAFREKVAASPVLEKIRSGLENTAEPGAFDTSLDILRRHGTFEVANIYRESAVQMVAGNIATYGPADSRSVQHVLFEAGSRRIAEPLAAPARAMTAWGRDLAADGLDQLAYRTLGGLGALGVGALTLGILMAKEQEDAAAARKRSAGNIATTLAASYVVSRMGTPTRG